MAEMNSDAMMADFLKSIDGDDDKGGTTTTGGGTMTAPAPVMNPGQQDEEKLLGEIQNSIKDMQDRMQDAYKNLQNRRAIGHSKDKRVTAEFTATYDFVDLDFNSDALEGGVDEFKQRIKEALKEATESVQKITQEQTMELLQNMQIPEDIRGMNGEGDAQ